MAYALSLAAVAPFAGYIQDMFGRRNVTLGGGFSLLMGCLILGTAHQFGQGIVGMCFSGAGAAIGELSALAGYDQVLHLDLENLTDIVAERQSWYQSTNADFILHLSLQSYFRSLPTCCTRNSSELTIPGAGVCGLLCCGTGCGGSSLLPYTSQSRRPVSRVRNSRRS